MIHAIKCSSLYFSDLLAGKKTFEIRRNDRDYRVNDYLAVNEVKHKTVPKKIGIPVSKSCSFTKLPVSPPSYKSAYSGRCALFRITYVLYDPNFLASGMVALGIEMVKLPYISSVDTNEEMRLLSEYGKVLIPVTDNNKIQR